MTSLVHSLIHPRLAFRDSILKRS